jgi:hypothetical protein
MRKRISAYICIIWSINLLSQPLQVQLTYRDSLNGAIRQIPRDKIVIVWNEYNCLPCFKDLYKHMVKGYHDGFAVVRVVGSDSDTSWAMHLKDVYFNKSVAIFFNYGDSALRYVRTPLVLVPTISGYERFTHQQMFKGTAIRKSFIKTIRKRRKHLL